MGGGDAGSLGRAATPRSPRPPRAACAAGHSPISRSRGFTAQESRAPFSPLLPSHGGSRVSLPGGPRQRQDPGRGGMPSGWRGAAAALPDRAKLLPGSRQPGLAFCRLSPDITAGGYLGEGTLPCCPGGRGNPAMGTRRTGNTPASPANPGRGSLAPHASAAPAPKRAGRKIKWWERCKAPWKG